MIDTWVMAVVQGSWRTVAATVGVAVTAAIACRLVRVVLLASLRIVADRRLTGRRAVIRWRTRLPRIGAEPPGLGELRRRHRIDASALALSRIAAVVISLAAGVWILHLYDIGVGVALSGAGFLGLVVAFSAQHSLNDYVAGLHVLLEDRYGEGDDIEVVAADGHTISGRVIALGAFSTRIRSDGAIHHLANRMMSEVANHSQVGVLSTVEIDEAADVVAPVVVAAAASALEARPRMPATVVERVDEVGDDGEAPRTQVTLRSTCVLGDTDRHLLGDRLRHLIDEQD